MAKRKTIIISVKHSYDYGFNHYKGLSNGKLMIKLFNGNGIYKYINDDNGKFRVFDSINDITDYLHTVNGLDLDYMLIKDN